MMKHIRINNAPASKEAVQRGRFLRLISLLLSLLFGVALVLSAVLNVKTIDLPFTLVLAGLALACGLNLASFIWISWANLRDSETAQFWASVMILVSAGLMPLVVPLVLQGSGAVVGLLSYGFAAWFGDRIFERRFMNRVLLAAPLLVLAVTLGDYFNPTERIQPLSPLYQYALIALLVVAILVYLVWRYGELPFRYKVAGSFILVSVISVAAVAGLSVYLSVQSVNRTSDLALLSAARSTARSLDNFVETMRTVTFSEAQIPALQNFMALDKTDDEQLIEISVIVNALARQHALSASTQVDFYDYIRRYLLVNAVGEIIYDSARASLGTSVADADYFTHGMSTDIPFISRLTFAEDGTPSLYAVARVTGELGRGLGILAVEIDPAVLQSIILQANDQVESRSFAVLVDDETGLRLAQGAATDRVYRVLTPLSLVNMQTLQEQGFLPEGSLLDLASDETGMGQVLGSTSGVVLDFETSRGTRNEGDALFGAIAPLESRPWRVLYVQTQAAILRPVQTQVLLIVLLAALVAAAAAGAALFIGGVLVKPVVDLKDLAQAVAGGNLNVRAPIIVQDEIGNLAESLNTMTDQLQQNIGDLERRVSDRTIDLERRGRQLLAAADIGRYVATIRNQDDLLYRSVRLISERFDFYHVGIFLLDAAGRFAVLSAANSEGGQRMLARGHRLAVGQQGIVGYATARGEPRIALDVGSDAVFFNNPDLPETRSELALPLRSGGRVLGALDVQSTHPQAFTQDDVSTLGVLADLLAVSIENVLLLNESEDALRSIRQAYGEISQRNWLERISASTVMGAEVGFVASERGITALNGGAAHAAPPILGTPILGTPAAEPASNLSLPIRVREAVIGTVEIVRPPSDGMTTEPAALSAEDLDLLTSLVDQLGVALDGARLYENSQLQAERERLVSEVSARIQESLDVDAVLRAAAVEIRQALGLREVSIIIDPAAGESAASPEESA